MPIEDYDRPYEFVAPATRTAEPAEPIRTTAVVDPEVAGKRELEAQRQSRLNAITQEKREIGRKIKDLEKEIKCSTDPIEKSAKQLKVQELKGELDKLEKERLSIKNSF